MNEQISRRDFLGTSTAGLVFALTITSDPLALTSEALADTGFRAPFHSGIQPSRSGLSADAPSGRLFVFPIAVAASTRSFQQVT